MKKRIFSLLCALLLVLSLTPVTAVAADKVFFTAVNDNFRPLTDTTMPFWSGGYLYVPASVFTLQELGISTSAPDGDTFMLYARNALTFNLETGTTTDSQGNTHPESAVTRGGRVFVPMVRVCDYFGLSCSYKEIPPYGYLVRVCSNSATMTDALFLDSASSQLDYRYNKYQQRNTPPAAIVVPPATVTPTEEIVPGGSQTLYLCLLAEDIDVVSGLLDALDAQGKSKATFYFPTPLLKSAGDLTRRMSATGHSIGLRVDAAAGAAVALRQLEEGNRLLSRATGAKTRLVTLTGATEQTAAAVAEAGWRVLEPEVDYGSRGLPNSAAASALLKRVAAYSGSVSVWLGGQVSAGALRAFVSSSRATQDKFLPLTELVQ